uniref:Cilia- and flagella-associated protein 300 n=2 Tax=Trichobilharzia regenti TaxID=157069 RepID=A0AA85JVT1_TRIRE|nr:unnamed protein product [Trichobilharzia regenti]
MEEDREEFILILEREYPSLSDKETKSFLLKWSMKGRLKAVTFTFDHMFAPYRADSFFTKFLNTSMVQQVLSIPPASINVNIKSVRCTLTNMDIFHKLSSLTYESGKIKKCMDEIFETILISDKLREVKILHIFYSLSVCCSKTHQIIACLQKKRGMSFCFVCSSTYVLEVRSVNKRMR